MPTQDQDPHFYEWIFHPLLEKLNHLSRSYVLRETKSKKLRTIVQQVPDLAAAESWLRGIPHAVGQNYTLGDPAGAKALECSAGKVVRFEVPPEFKVPHMGWNQARILNRAPLLEGIDDGAYFYFVHSYYVVPQDRQLVAIETEYHQPFCAMAWRDNLFATQFHPEKSQSNGLTLLRNFAELPST